VKIAKATPNRPPRAAIYLEFNVTTFNFLSEKAQVAFASASAADIFFAGEEALNSVIDKHSPGPSNFYNKLEVAKISLTIVLASSTESGRLGNKFYIGSWRNQRAIAALFSVASRRTLP
jgi:hypothetical protein